MIASMTEGELREREWLESEVALAASLTDQDRIRILRDLIRTAAAIRASKSAEQLRRDEEVRWVLEDLPAIERYRAAAERFG